MKQVSFLIFSLSICFINKSISQEYEKVNGLWNAAFVDLPISKKISFRNPEAALDFYRCTKKKYKNFIHLIYIVI